MQVFEVFELAEPPYMEAKEVFAETANELINEDKVLILIDHNEKKIWTFYGSKCSLKLQLFGGILARRFRGQLKLFYRVFNLNEYSLEIKNVQKILEQKVAHSKAVDITPENYEKFSIPGEKVEKVTNLCVHRGLKKKEAIETLKSIPKPTNFISKFIIIGGDFYNYDSEMDKFISEKSEQIKINKIGEIPSGFFFDNAHEYSTRLIIKNGKVQSIEYYVSEESEIMKKSLDVPVFFEERFQTPGDINALLNAFNVPESLPEHETETQQEINGDTSKSN
jgi:hypothetical protein